ncbi:ROK family protein (putative glucokinase) [Cyclobacterium lianum]|uniref:ROK family protein (Putative glucokinase) n=1 Tax=Cyclobacterium lianum TaxID=388280 RepID=A0A1M7QSL1_9BACT|nr:ROK family protein [Cyclobacterium lianum]SHN34509.1 ROK family protein (putative glucokinase) [Cyclobacterium lianum]
MNLIDPKIVLDKKEGVVEIKNYINKLKIVKELYTLGNNTANNICQLVGISLPTVNLLLADLLEENIVVKEGRGQSQGGRKPDLYGLAPNSFFILGIDLSRYGAKAAIYNTKNERVTKVKTVKVTLNNDPSTLDEIYDFSMEVIASSGIPEDRVIAVGISMPGLVDGAAGINHTHLKSGKKPLKDQLESKFQRKVFIENDARAKTLAEFRFGNNHGQKNVLGIFVDWGIGLGIIIDGKLYRGYSGFAGEFSHSPLFDAKEISCSCGKRGCLESVASGGAVVRLAKEAIHLDKDSILARLSEGKEENIDPSVVVDAATAGDQRAISILSDVGLDLGRGIAILIQLFNPELIILGGAIAEANQYITTPIQQALNIYSMAKLREKTAIELSQLGKEVGLRGAIAIVNEHIFEDTINSY